MSKNLGRSTFFDSVREGIEEGILFAKGELKLRTTEVVATPPGLNGRDVVRLRQQLEMSQGVFARLLNVSKKTVEGWERGERHPAQAALRLLQVIAADPAAYCRIVGIRQAGSSRNRGVRQKVQN